MLRTSGGRRKNGKVVMASSMDRQCDTEWRWPNFGCVILVVMLMRGGSSQMTTIFCGYVRALTVVMIVMES